MFSVSSLESIYSCSPEKLIEINIAREDESGYADDVNQKRNIWAREKETCDYHELA